MYPAQLLEQSKNPRSQDGIFISVCFFGIWRRHSFFSSFFISLYLIKTRSVHLNRDDGLQKVVPAWLMELQNISQDESQNMVTNTSFLISVYHLHAYCIQVLQIIHQLIFITIHHQYIIGARHKNSCRETEFIVF